MQVVEIAPSDVLKKFSGALHALRTELSSLAPSYRDVGLSQLSRVGGWWVDDEHQLIGRSWLFGLLAGSDVPPHETAMVWNGNSWQLTDGLKEAGPSYTHVNNPLDWPEHFGGREPAPDDDDGKDQKDEIGKMTLESIRKLVRKIAKEYIR